MNSDSHFLIGDGHQICEDYAISGKYKDLYYGIVADGCSSSKDTDIGARILVKSAEDVIKNLYNHNYSSDWFYKSPGWFYKLFGITIISNSQKIVRSMGISDFALDSTLLFVVGHEFSSRVVVFIYGDGSYSYYDESGLLHIINVDYKNRAFYLSYLLDEDRKGEYEKVNYNVDITHLIKKDEDFVVSDKLVYPYDYSMGFIFDVGFCVSIMSDGVGTFNQSQNETIEEFMSFKNFNGGFVKRRMNAIKRKCIKDNIKHFDDISMATIYIGG